MPIRDFTSLIGGGDISEPIADFTSLLGKQDEKRKLVGEQNKIYDEWLANKGERGFVPFMKDVGASAIPGLAGAVDTAALIADLLNPYTAETQPLHKASKQATENYRTVAQDLAKGGQPEGLGKVAAQTLGGFAGSLPEMALIAPSGPIGFAAHGALKALESGEEPISAGLRGGTTGLAFELAKHAPGPLGKILGSAAAFAGPSEAQRVIDKRPIEKPEETLANIILGAALAAKGSMREKPKPRDQILDIIRTAPEQQAQQAVSESPTTKLVTQPEMIPPEQSATSVLKPGIIKQPWEMTKKEFDNEALYQGVTDITDKKTNYFTNSQGFAEGFANAPRGGNNPRLNIAFKQDIKPEQYPFKEGTENYETPQEYWKNRSEMEIPELSPRTTIPITESKNPHKYLVEKALANGEKIPQDVLSEYPELKPEPTISAPSEQPTMVAPEQNVEKPVEPGRVTNIHAEKLASKVTEELSDIAGGTWGMEVGEKATHLKMNLAEQARMATELWEKNPELANEVALGKKNVPNMIGADGHPLKEEAVWVAGKNKAIADGDVEAIMRFAKDSPVQEKISQAGKSLVLLRSSNPEDPVYQIMDINKVRTEANQKRAESQRTKAIEDERFAKLEQELANKTKLLDDIQNRKTIKDMQYVVRKKGRIRAKEILDSEFSEITRTLTKELSTQMNIGLDPKHIKMLGQLAINRVEKGFKTIEQVVDDIHEAIGGVIDKRLIRDAISSYGKKSELSKDEIDKQLREVKRQGRLISSIEDVESGMAPLRSGLQRDKPSERVLELQKQLKEGMIKNGFVIEKNAMDQQWKNMKEGGKGKKLFNPEDQYAISKEQLSDWWNNLNESTSGKKLFASPEEQQLTVMERYRKHLAKREEIFTKKLTEGDYETKPRMKTPLDTQMQSTKDHVDRMSKEYGKLKEIRERRANGVSNREATKIVELSKNVSRNKEAVVDWNDRSADGKALTYGRSLVDFYDYTNNLKLRAQKRTGREAIGEFKEHPFKETGRALVKAGGVSKSILSSMDNSALGRQGMKIFWSEMFKKNNVWLKNAKQSFRDIVNQFGGENVMHEVQADVLSRPNSLNGRYKKAKVDVGNIEESFPEQLPGKIPYLRVPYKASEVAFVGFQYRSRADLADRYFKLAEEMGVKVDAVDPVTKKPQELESIGKFVNALTGRGKLKHLEPISGPLNNIFFSPRFFKSNWDFLTMQTFQDPSPFVRKQAAISLAKYVAGTAVALAIAEQFGAKVEKDPRSADFGKIRVDSTRFDISGGVAPLITFATRMGFAMGSTATNLVSKHKPWMATKSSLTGKLTPLTSGKSYTMTGLDTVMNMGTGKLAPVPSVLRGLITGVDANRKELTLGGILFNALAPIGIQSAEQMRKNKDAAPLWLTLPAEFFGIGASTYGKGNKKQRPVGTATNINDFTSLLK